MKVSSFKQALGDRKCPFSSITSCGRVLRKGARKPGLECAVLLELAKLERERVFFFFFFLRVKMSMWITA